MADERWAIARLGQEGSHDEVVFRYPEEIDPNIQRVHQANEMTVVWKYQSETGQPSVSDFDRMSFLEGALEAALEKDGFATLALVATGGGVREWTYYAKSEEEFFQRLNQALRGQARFPIEIHGSTDPSWGTYEDFMTKVRHS